MQTISSNPRPGRLTSLDEAISRLRRLLPRIPPQMRSLKQALGNVLAEDVVVDADLPRVPLAYTDGWAVQAASLVGASSYGTIPLEKPPAWVDAGSAMPEGDAILPVNELIFDADGVSEALASVVPGEGVRMPGQDALAATAIVKQGVRLDARHLAVLQACGIESVAVRVPRVRLVLASTAALPHAHMLCAWLTKAGCEIIDVVDTSDQRQELAACYRYPDADLVVSVGGTGQGRNDSAVAALASVGVVDVHGIALRPGASAGFGRAGATCVLLLPGRIDSLLAGLLVLALPMLATLSGLKESDPCVQTRLVGKVASAVGLSEIFLATPVAEGIRPSPLAEARLDTIAGAAGWFLVPAQLEGAADGDVMRWQPF